MPEVRINVATAPGELEAAYAIRREVFCREQGVAEALEIDGRDGEARHYLVRAGGRPIGTARVRTLAPGVAKIERVAVIAARRGAGIGRRLMERILADLAAEGAASAVLHAQEYAAAFYARLGFAVEGAPFEEAGIPHVRMRRPVAQAGGNEKSTP